jgi:hypothetical protein
MKTRPTNAKKHEKQSKKLTKESTALDATAQLVAQYALHGAMATKSAAVNKQKNKPPTGGFIFIKINNKEGICPN